MKRGLGTLDRQQMNRIFQYIDPRLVTFLDAKTQDEAIEQLVHLAHAMGKIPDLDLFIQAIFEREKIVSTGIGMGIAIPHAKLDCFHDFFISIAVLKTPLNWNSLDGAPVRMVFLIGGPDDRQTEYLQLLSSLTYLLKDESIRKQVLTASDPHQIVDLFNPD